MIRIKRLLSTILVLAIALTLLGVDTVKSANSTSVTIKVDTTKKFQTIDGFGFFGAQDVWWGSQNPNSFYSDAWLEKIVSDLGMTIWRNELQPYNPVDSNNASNSQSANWSKQNNMIQALKNKSIDKGEPLKVILTVWSPPGEFKIDCPDLAGQPNSWVTRGGSHNSTLNGGTLNPLKYREYAQWIIDGLKLYKSAGVDVYAVSLQNELLFVEPYNSCVYTCQWYTDLLNNVVPIIKASFPNVKIFGAENMLDSEASNPTSNYTGTIIQDPATLKNIDIFAFHGYSDGVQATAIEKHKALWETAYENFYVPTKKPLWMTETSGFGENWLANGTPGSLDLGIAIESSLKYGKAAGWVYWSGSEARSGANNVFSLMDGTTVKKRYYVSKQFYRYIRPGAVMLDAESSDSDVLSTAFYNNASNTFTSVLINTTNVDKVVSLTGNSIPASFTGYLTTSDTTKNCSDIGTLNNGAISLPANSILTLVANATMPVVPPKATASPIPTLEPNATSLPVPTPLAPTVKTITNQSDTILGTAANGGTVSVNVPLKSYSAEIFSGTWEVFLSKTWAAGTKITYQLKLFNGFLSSSKSIYVIPYTPTVKTIKKNSVTITGTATRGSTVYAKIGTKTYLAKASTKNGVYTIKIPEIKVKTVVVVKCKAGGQMSKTTTVKAI